MTQLDPLVEALGKVLRDALIPGREGPMRLLQPYLTQEQRALAASALAPRIREALREVSLEVIAGTYNALRDQGYQTPNSLVDMVPRVQHEAEDAFIEGLSQEVKT